MKRPSPLPGGSASSRDEQPVDPPFDPRTWSEPESAAIEDERIADADAAETAPIQPLFPVPSPRTDEPASLTQDPDATPDVGERPVGVREVWRAARARRKMLRAEVRRFTTRARRRRTTWIIVIGSFLAIAAITVGAAYSPLFALERVSVVGTSTLPASDVETALADQLGTPLAAVDESAVKAALVQFPLVESYTLEARPPHELVVRIVERTPIGYVQTDAGFTVLDAAGVVLSTTEAAPEGLAQLDVASGVDSRAFTAVGQVMRALPGALRAQVTAAAASTADDVTLTLGGTNTSVVWGNAEQSTFKARVLETAMIANPPDAVSVYDVSTPNAIVVR